MCTERIQVIDLKSTLGIVLPPMRYGNVPTMISCSRQETLPYQMCTTHFYIDYHLIISKVKALLKIQRGGVKFPNFVLTSMTYFCAVDSCPASTRPYVSTDFHSSIANLIFRVLWTSWLPHRARRKYLRLYWFCLHDQHSSIKNTAKCLPFLTG